MASPGSDQVGTLTVECLICICPYIRALFIKILKKIELTHCLKSSVTSFNAKILQEIYVLIYLTVSKSACNCFEWFEFYVLISFLDFDTRQNMHNQNEAVLGH